MRRPHLLLFSIFIALAIYCACISGDETNTAFYIVENGTPLHQKLLNELRDEIVTRKLSKVRFITTNELQGLYQNNDLPACAVVMPVGTEITKTIIEQNIDAPVLSIALPRINYVSLHKSRGHNQSIPPFSAIFLDQPISRRLDLLHELLPTAKSIAVLLGPSTNDLQQELSVTLKAHNYRAKIDFYDGSNSLINTLDRLLENSDAMLSIADPIIYNADNARNILLTAYHWRVPLIGLSPAYVRAGALAAVYTSPDQLATQVAEIIESHQSCNSIEHIQSVYPKYFDVIVNYQVAEAIGVVVDSQERLRSKLAPDHTKVMPE